MRKIIFTLIIVAFVCSCSKEKQQKGNSKVETPEAFQNDSDISSRLSKKRYNIDIIDRLYEEALEKDVSLKKLDESFVLIHKEKKDSLHGFDNFDVNNNKYWASVDGYLSNIKDTVLRDMVSKDFEKFEREYEKSIRSLKVKDSTLIKKARMLDDYQTIMKLRVSYRMMKKYNENEFPKEDNHIYIGKKYDSLIEEVKKQLKK